jgi:hypothetical protein
MTSGREWHVRGYCSRCPNNPRPPDLIDALTDCTVDIGETRAAAEGVAQEGG